MKSRHMITTTPAQAEEWGVGGGVENRDREEKGEGRGGVKENRRHH